MAWFDEPLVNKCHHHLARVVDVVWVLRVQYVPARHRSLKCYRRYRRPSAYLHAQSKNVSLSPRRAMHRWQLYSVELCVPLVHMHFRRLLNALTLAREAPRWKGICSRGYIRCWWTHSQLPSALAAIALRHLNNVLLVKHQSPPTSDRHHNTSLSNTLRIATDVSWKTHRWGPFQNQQTMSKHLYVDLFRLHIAALLGISYQVNYRDLSMTDW